MVRVTTLKFFGELAQLARALDLHSRGQGFDSLILHGFTDNTVKRCVKTHCKGSLT